MKQSKIRKKLEFTERQKQVRSLLDRITPAILKRYKSKELVNSPELNNIAMQELKREYLKLVKEPEVALSNVALEMIQENPRFMIAGINPWILFAMHGKDPYDYEIFPNMQEREMAVRWATLGRDTPENRKVACEFYGVLYHDNQNIL